MSLFGGVFSMLGNIAAGAMQQKSIRETNAINNANWQKQFAYNQSVDERNFRYAQQLNDQSQRNWQEQFYHGISTAARDAASVGINPLVMSGSASGSASFSGASSTGAPSAPSAIPQDYSFLNNLFSGLVDINFRNRELGISDKKADIDQQNANTAEYNAGTQRTAAEAAAKTAEYNAETQRAAAEAAAKTAEYNAETQRLIALRNPVQTISNAIRSIKEDLIPAVKDAVSFEFSKMTQKKKDKFQAKVDNMSSSLKVMSDSDRKAIFGDHDIEGLIDNFNSSSGAKKDAAARDLVRVLKAQSVYDNLQKLREREGRPY